MYSLFIYTLLFKFSIKFNLTQKTLLRIWFHKYKKFFILKNKIIFFIIHYFRKKNELVYTPALKYVLIYF